MRKRQPRAERSPIVRNEEGERFEFMMGLLEPRLLLSGACADDLPHPTPRPDATLVAPAEAALTPTGALSAVAVAGGVPLLSSNPRASAKLYLDFDGDAGTTWGSFSVSATPAYDTDGNPASFSDAELSNINAIWARVAEKYSPFNIDVTTVNPGALTDRVGLRAVIGGGGSWAGGGGGIAYIGGFYNSAPNTVYAFSANLGNGGPSYTAEAVAHESGHAFGLQHQSSYSGSTKTADYNLGNSLTAPILGNSYYAQRGIWWHGTTTSSTTMQDDLAVLSGAANGFGYRADDHASAISGATAMTLDGSGALGGSGIIERMSDADYFSFSTAGGRVTFTGSVAGQGAMLDLKLELRSASGALLAAADTAALGETLSADLAAGSYYLVAASHDAYGDVGQYSISGNLAIPESYAAAPTNLTATPISASQVALAWTDQSSNETAFIVHRSADGGVTWSTRATLGAGTTSYTDPAASAGATYLYRISAATATSQSAYSNLASATTVPAAPSSLTAAALSSTQIKLAWSDVTGETAYAVERSLDGVGGWVSVYNAPPDSTGFTDDGLLADTSYFYRVTAVGQFGSSSFAGPAGGRTFAAPVAVAPAAPGSVTALMIHKFKVRVSWADNSRDESGFTVQRSADGGARWTTIATLAANSTAFTDSGHRLGSAQYRIAAFNSAGSSPFSAPTSVAAADRYAARSAAPRSASVTGAGESLFDERPATGVLQRGGNEHAA